MQKIERRLATLAIFSFVVMNGKKDLLVHIAKVVEVWNFFLN
jgi:hypothetical protein